MACFLCSDKGVVTKRDGTEAPCPGCQTSADLSPAVKPIPAKPAKSARVRSAEEEDADEAESKAAKDFDQMTRGMTPEAKARYIKAHKRVAAMAGVESDDEEDEDVPDSDLEEEEEEPLHKPGEFGDEEDASAPSARTLLKDMERIAKHGRTPGAMVKPPKPTTTGPCPTCGGHTTIVEHGKRKLCPACRGSGEEKLARVTICFTDEPGGRCQMQVKFSPEFKDGDIPTAAQTAALNMLEEFRKSAEANGIGLQAEEILDPDAQKMIDAGILTREEISEAKKRKVAEMFDSIPIGG